mmetsp:Transcript_13493/g.43953  ORF Transcript_13493/g.43953 Transcript_13493/m.43953 type:complete len:633 (-) Transcript_13493:217-2115(-)
MGERWWDNTAYDFAGAGEEGEDQYETTGSEWLGRRLLRVFGSRKVYCVVDGYLPAGKNDGRAFWRVRHDDGDDEDLELHEVREAFAAYEAHPKKKDVIDLAGDDDDDDEEEEEDRRARETTSSEAGPPPAPSEEEAAKKLEETTAPGWPEDFEAEDECALMAFRGLERAARELEAGESYGECVLFFSEVGRTASEPLRGLALYHAERAARKCLERHRASKKKLPEHPQQICDLLEDAFALERVGVGSYDLKLHCERVAGAISRKRGKAGAATAFFGYDVFGLSSFRPSADLDECVLDELTALERRGVFPTKFRAVAGALYTAFYADRLGVDLVGAADNNDDGDAPGGLGGNNGNNATTKTESSLLEQVLKSGAPSIRAAYTQDPTKKDWDTFLDQLLCVGAVLDCLSNFGDLRLRSWAVPHEYAAIVDPRAIKAAVARGDVQAVADLARLARLFSPGDDRARAVVDTAVPFLLSATWEPRGDPDLPYARFKAQADVVRALYEPTRRGFGASLPDLPDLLKNLAERKNHKRIRLDAVDAFAQCAVKLADPAKADALHAVYAGAGRAPEHDDDDDVSKDDAAAASQRKRSLRDVAAKRLDGILKFKLLTEGTAHFARQTPDHQPAKRRRNQILR